MAVYNKMTESKFNAVKLLLKAGASYKECMQYLQVSEGVVYRCRAAETWEEYLQMNAARAIAEKKVKLQKKQAAEEKQQETKQEPVQELQQVAAVVVQPPVDRAASSYQTNRMIEEMKQTNELLKLISNKLAFIVEQLA